MNFRSVNASDVNSKPSYYFFNILLKLWHLGFGLTCFLSFTDAPIISVTDATFEKSKATRTVTCVPIGNPGINTFYKWQHRSKHGVLIRDLDGGGNGVLTIPNIPVDDRYQDSGEYVCTAGNGIVGKDDNVKQTGSGYVTVYGM